jgi:hypothetical protein
MAEETAMSEVATQKPATPTISGAKPSFSDDDIKRLLKRAGEGDRDCLPEVRVLLADEDNGATYREFYGSSAEWLRHSVIKKAAGRHVLRQEAIEQELERIGSDLQGRNPTPIERLLAERASLCWFIVHWYESTYANADGWNIANADFQHRKIDRAHRRFLTAVRTLAQIRKLALPTLQVNIARNQVNVAESGP